MRPPKQKQPQVKKGLCRVLEHVDVDLVPCEQLVSPTLPERSTTASNRLIFHRACAKYVTPHVMYLTSLRLISREIKSPKRRRYVAERTRKRQNKFTNSFYGFKFNLFDLGAGRRLTQRNQRLLAVVSPSGSVGETNCS